MTEFDRSEILAMDDGRITLTDLLKLINEEMDRFEVVGTDLVKVAINRYAWDDDTHLVLFYYKEVKK